MRAAQCDAVSFEGLLLSCPRVVIVQNNPLKNAPHTARVVISDKWDRPYSREEAAYPAPWYVTMALLLLDTPLIDGFVWCPRVRENKFWPHVGRLDNVHGDR